MAKKQETWSADWVFGLPLILLTVLINIVGLGLMGWRIVRQHHVDQTRFH